MRNLSIVFILILLAPAEAAKVFQHKYTLWAPTEVLLYPQNLEIDDFSPGSLCFEIASQQKSMRGTACRIAGALQRDTLSATYFSWLAQNLDPQSTVASLAARNPAVQNYFNLLDDRFLIFIHQSQDTTWTVLFAGPRALIDPESMQNSPIAMHYKTEIKTAAELNKFIQQTYFKQKTTPRLSPQQKLFADTAPDEQYNISTELDVWAALSYGKTTAQIPLTPDNWYARKRASRMGNYRVIADSSSSWNILEDQSDLFAIRSGFTWRDFVGAELFLLYSQHPVKLDTKDKVYQELKNWSFDRYEVGITAHFVHNRKLGARLLWQPTAFIGFHYSFFHEKIALNPGQTGSDAYHRRLKFMPFYKGTIFGLSQRLIWNRTIAIEARTGLNNRSRSQTQNPSMDEVNEPTIIGASTLDWFISTALEYHWTWEDL
ncbi:MAG: hypothetical protein GX801_09265 [Fibrobacter sp.]|nr:hypothetical protein [Fibrobacter sp.]